VDLIGIMALDMVLFYGSLAVLTLCLWRSATGKRVLLLAAFVAIPHFALAMAYESGDPSRYIPLLTVLWLAFGYCVASGKLRTGTRVCLALLCCAPGVANLAKELRSSPAAEEARVAALASAPKTDLFYVLNLRDSLWRSAYPSTFQPAIFRIPQLRTLDSNGARSSSWRSDFACMTLTSWENGGEIWITRRVLANIPERSWMWIEGDEPGNPWEGLHRFFAGLERGEERGGVDGFFLLAKTDRNSSVLENSLPASSSVRRPSCAGALDRTAPQNLQGWLAGRIK
jgi:hypothetical protein